MYFIDISPWLLLRGLVRAPETRNIDLLHAHQGSRDASRCLRVAIAHQLDQRVVIFCVRAMLGSYGCWPCVGRAWCSRSRLPELYMGFEWQEPRATSSSARRRKQAYF